MQNRYRWLTRLPQAIGILLSTMLIMTIYSLQNEVERPPQTKKAVQQITLLQQPPPPPPMDQIPPEPEPEQSLDQEPEQQPEPLPQESDATASGLIGLDTEGVAGDDGFGLRANKGGRALLSGTPGSAMLWYGGQVKRQLEEGLQNLLVNSAAAQTSYSVLIEVWIDADGHVSRTELASGSGIAEVDQALRAALPKLSVSIGKSPPEGMPQPVKIRWDART